MSGTSYEGTCPKCGGTTDCYSDWKPFDTVNAVCLACGWQCWTEEGQLTAEELEDHKKEIGYYEVN